MSPFQSVSSAYKVIKPDLYNKKQLKNETQFSLHHMAELEHQTKSKNILLISTFYKYIQRTYNQLAMLSIRVILEKKMKKEKPTFQSFSSPFTLIESYFSKKKKSKLYFFLTNKNKLYLFLQKFETVTH